MRTKFRSVWILLFCIGGILSMSGCKKKEDLKTILSSESVAEKGELKVSYSSPMGQTSEEHESDTIVAIFDHPMFPLSSFDEQKKPNLIKISPNIPGTFRWLNPKTLAFSPEDRFPYSTEVKITIESGTRTYDGYVLKEDHIWSFTTIRPLLTQHFPQNKQKWIRLEEKILLVFNQPVQAAENMEVIQMVGLDRNSTESSIEIILKHPTDKQLKDAEIQAQAAEVLILEPSEPMKPDTNYYIEIQPGLLGKEGSLGMANGRIFEFSTFNSFRFESFEPQQGYDIYQPLKFQFSNPVDYKEFIQKIRFEPEVSIPDYYLEWDQSNSTLWLSLSFLPETKYKLWIAADLEDDFGNKLEKDINLAFSTPQYPRSIIMNTGHGILEAYADLKYPISAVNADNVFIHGGSVAKQDVIPLLRTQKIFWSNEKISKRGLFSVEKFMKLNPPRNTRAAFPIEIKEFMNDKFGFVFIQADTLSEEEWERYPKAFLQITELGISGKFSRENNTIWVTELKTGLPVPNSQIEIRDDENRIRWSGKTDNDGIAITPGWGPLNIPSQDRWSKPQQWIFASRGKDTTFLSSEWGTGVYPYYFDIQYDWNPQPIQQQGYMFTERGIYRAGETVHIKGIFREQKMSEWIILPVKEVSCEILDPFQKSVFKENLPVDSFGSIHFDFTTAQDSSLGEYQIQTSIPAQVEGDDPFSVFSSFRVEAFRPAEFEVHLRTAEESFTFGETYTGELRASYLFGGAMSGQDISWYLRLNPTQYTPPGHKGYVFGDQISRWETFREEENRLLSSGEASLDKEGKTKISAKLESQKEGDSVLAVLEATVRGPNRQSITNRIQTIVHRGDFYIGLQSSSTFLSSGDNIDVNVIAVEPEGNLLSGKNIQFTLFKREWNSVRKSEFGGRFRWISEKKDTEVETRTIQTKEEEETVTFFPENSGFYILKAQGKDKKGNIIITTTYFYVTGEDYVPWERLDDDAVELVANDTAYQPGDVAKILVKSPYESAKALITVEREFILHSEVVDLIGSSATIEIPIVSEHIPNVFVSVLLVQGRVSPQDSDSNGDIGKPSFKIGYIELAVDPSEKRLNVDIQSNKPNYKLGEEITLTLDTKDWQGVGTESSIMVAVVDVGVLNLIGYQTPDPFSLFYSHKLLSVQTSEVRQHIIEQRFYGEKGDEVGGGAGEEKMAAFARALNEVELRGNFKLTAYWNPSVLTDDGGNASVTFKLPDNLTTFRIMAVAQTKDSQFGRSEKTFKVSKQLLLQPSLPRFARIGDSFEGGVVVHNYSSEKGQVTLNCVTEGIQLGQSSERSFILDSGEGKEILFEFKAESPGEARIMFRAQMGQESDGLEMDLPLIIPRPTETVALFNSTTESMEEQIKIPESIYPFESLIQVLASSSALSGLKGSVDFLTNYPYFCLEQRLSRILPFVFAEDLIIDFRLSEMSRRDIRQYVQKEIDDIYSFQRPNGGFSLWPESLNESAINSC
ncbi:MAG: MG2 domain-containing protein, partial [Candidatus Aminicenantes bacterium]|nr:MG2 domain-containing protein [Candidatus Aminicenantes bacterium]